MALVPVASGLRDMHLTSFAGLNQKDLLPPQRQRDLVTTAIQQGVGQRVASISASQQMSPVLLDGQNKKLRLVKRLADISTEAKSGFMQLTALPGVIHATGLCNKITMVNSRLPCTEMSLVPNSDFCYDEQMTSLNLLKQFIAGVNPLFRFNRTPSIFPHRIAGLVPSCLFPLWNDVFFDLRSTLPVTRTNFIVKSFSFSGKKALVQDPDSNGTNEDGATYHADTHDTDQASQIDNSTGLKNRITSIIRRLLPF